MNCSIRIRITDCVAGCLAQENDIGVRLRIADALGHLGNCTGDSEELMKNPFTKNYPNVIYRVESRRWIEIGQSALFQGF
ncbi:MAG: hypothetical protein GY749_09605 [Desulfobacteraceae bacterium]|nr:hypothetical protein [Desulfobacteraceae bacterium]